ncbi:hypothetical protein [Corynebacterium sp. ACRPH]|uniref:hypothetical protein n=1 Tax=Corynebacterium sp. ACRPH TaxID=2918199 RepID=UPI001EF1D97B|nr:hypothetical protein [Corynebacterium sp. ACRPH]MCG7457573.1 hypothetical protein [Corynebacterium sp. ACRPH]
MEIPNPHHRKDKTIDEHFVRLFKEIKPDFQQDPDSIFDWMQEAKRDLTPAQKRQFIKDHRHEAELTLDERSRAFMRVLINLGAKDLDITNAVDEMLKYIDCGGKSSDIRAIVDADTNLILYNIHPKNFEQINRFLKATSTNEPEILFEWQRFLIKQGVRKKAFREYPGFHWIKTSAFAEHPRAKEHVAKLADPS